MNGTSQDARPSYATQEEALRRVEVLKQRGIWPGVQRLPDGRYALLHDPDVTR